MTDKGSSKTASLDAVFRHITTEKNSTVYTIYTAEFDRIARPDEIIPGKELDALNHALASNVFQDADLSTAALNVQNIASGYTKKGSASVTLLLDNSGSLRGRGLIQMLGLTYILGDALDNLGVSFEVLGYTTSEWKGGKARQKWIQNGRTPASPGRLNDVLHVIYKGFDDKWQDTKDGLALMTHKGFLKENIDGEAIEWAQSRAEKYNQSRKILIPLTDGAPIDDSTLSCNPNGLLSSHLAYALEHAQKRGIEVYPVGISYNTEKTHGTPLVTVEKNDNLEAAASKILTQIARRGPLVQKINRHPHPRKFIFTDRSAPK